MTTNTWQHKLPPVRVSAGNPFLADPNVVENVLHNEVLAIDKTQHNFQTKNEFADCTRVD